MDFRQRLEQSRNIPASGETPVEPSDYLPNPYFATDRNNRVNCLELRLPNGVRKALPYAFITEITSEIDAGIEILTQGKKISIIGRNLAKLFDHLTAYRVRYIQTNIGNDTGEDGLFVKEITIEELD